MHPLEIGGIDLQGQIDLLNKLYKVTVFNHSGESDLHIGDGDPQYADLSIEDDYHLVRLGDQKARIRMVVKGETA